MITNKGVEISLDITPVLTNNFSWTSTFNYSKNNNEVVEMHEDLNAITTGASEGYGSRFVAGGSIGDLFVLMFERDDQGRIILDPITGAPTKTPVQEYAGNLNPDWILGWDNRFEMGKFALNFLIVGKFGGISFSQTESMLDKAGTSQRTADARDAGGVSVNAVQDGASVSTVDPETWYFTVGGRNGIGEPYVYDRSNLRLSQFALSYNFNWSTKNFPTTVSLVGQNLFFFYNESPFDPDLAMSTTRSAEALDNFNLPATRTFGFNLKVTF
ncbi:MAG: hypothetical protein KAI29_22130 [Cyclobacteriaceae bacterium]|nr:hypothetical protein [Cyclobacteriaceae bacterium]